MAYSIVWYRKQNEDEAAFVVDKVLQFLAVPLMAMTFYLSPPVRRAFKQYLADRRECCRVRRAKRSGRMRSLAPSPTSNTRGEEETPRLRIPSYYGMQSSSPPQLTESTLYSDEDEAENELYSL
ncbi:hypothetical protein IWW38_004788 [Coemansia aciculifera]|uniref:Uncharacterized protein n=1 Tax=Coemansia aciculifera TaxID=417176 RepID=A0ACC1LXN2_9FUNG|nr:hypothetical protein IWW38_004788 [Coemansia aciculifera]